MTTATLTRSAATGRGRLRLPLRRHDGVAQAAQRPLHLVDGLVFAAGMIGLAILALGHEQWSSMSAADRASFDPVNQGFTGLALGQLVLGVLGVLMITAEFSSGMIRATLAAVPRRPVVLAAKAAVLGAVTLAIGEVFAFAAFAVGEAVLRSPAPHASLGQPGVLRAVLLGGAYPALIALIALGLGAVIRNTAAGISRGGRDLVRGAADPAAAGNLDPALGRRSSCPMMIAENSMTMVKPPRTACRPAWAGHAVRVRGGALAAGGWALARRDA